LVPSEYKQSYEQFFFRDYDVKILTFISSMQYAPLAFHDRQMCYYKVVLNRVNMLELEQPKLFSCFVNGKEMVVNGGKYDR